MTVLDPNSLLFHCEFCNSILEQRDNATKIASSRNMHGRLMEQLNVILTLLKETDHFVMPTHKKLLSTAKDEKDSSTSYPEGQSNTLISQMGDDISHLKSKDFIFIMNITDHFNHDPFLVFRF
jgi:nitrate reductase beta subunit